MRNLISCLLDTTFKSNCIMNNNALKTCLSFFFELYFGFFFCFVSRSFIRLTWIFLLFYYLHFNFYCYDFEFNFSFFFRSIFSFVSLCGYYCRYGMVFSCSCCCCRKVVVIVSRFKDLEPFRFAF